jgi:hypothetical protein
MEAPMEEPDNDSTPPSPASSAAETIVVKRLMAAFIRSDYQRRLAKFRDANTGEILMLQDASGLAYRTRPDKAPPQHGGKPICLVAFEIKPNLPEDIDGSMFSMEFHRWMTLDEYVSVADKSMGRRRY